MPNIPKTKTVTLTLAGGVASGGTDSLFGIAQGSKLLSLYVERGSMGVNRKAEIGMYGSAGYSIGIYDGGSATTSTSASVTIVYLEP